METVGLIGTVGLIIIVATALGAAAMTVKVQYNLTWKGIVKTIFGDF